MAKFGDIFGSNHLQDLRELVSEILDDDYHVGEWFCLFHHPESRSAVSNKLLLSFTGTIQLVQ